MCFGEHEGTHQHEARGVVVGFLESSERKSCGFSANLENVWSGGKFWSWYLVGEVDESRTPCRDWVGAEDSMRTLAHAIVGEAGTLGTGGMGVV